MGHSEGCRVGQGGLCAEGGTSSQLPSTAQQTDCDHGSQQRAQVSITEVAMGKRVQTAI